MVVVLYLLTYCYILVLLAVQEMELSGLDLDVAGSGNRDTSPPEAATSTSEQHPVTREDWNQAEKPPTRQIPISHRPITRSLSKIRSDTPSCIASSDTIDDVWASTVTADTISSAYTAQIGLQPVITTDNTDLTTVTTVIPPITPVFQPVTLVPTRRLSTVTRAATPKNLSVPVHGYDELSTIDVPAQNAALDDTVVINDNFMNERAVMNEPAVVNERAVDSTRNVDDVIMHAHAVDVNNREYGNVTDVNDRMRGNIDHFAVHDAVSYTHLTLPTKRIV